MIATAVIFSIIVIVCSVFIAIQTGDGYWLNRSGSLIAGVAAGLAILEASLERRSKMLEHQSGEARRRFGSPLVNIAQRVRRARFVDVYGEATRQHVSAVVWISLIAISGELLHGFGDIALHFILKVVGGPDLILGH